MNPFIGLTETQLVAKLRLAQEDLAAGKTVTGAGAGDARFDNEVSSDPLKRIELILRALNLINPVTYPSDQIKRVTRTRLSVYGCEN